MAASKLNQADAQEWLESLKLVGEGWWRQVGLAVRAGAPKALGITRREFAQAIGQRLIDPRDAIIELHKEGHSVQAIAEILGVAHDTTVSRVLAEEGLIEWRPAVQKALESREPREEEEDSSREPRAEDLQTRIEALEIQLTGAEAKRKKDVDAVKKKMTDLRKEITEERRRLREEAQNALTKQERERAAKEADAWAQEQGRKVIAGLAHLAVDHIVGALEEAAAEIRMLIEQDAITEDAIRQIESAHAGFSEELNVARLAAAATS